MTLFLIKTQKMTKKRVIFRAFFGLFWGFFGVFRGGENWGKIGEFWGIARSKFIKGWYRERRGWCASGRGPGAPGFPREKGGKRGGNDQKWSKMTKKGSFFALFLVKNSLFF